MSINRILVVGLGSIGKRHLRIARTIFPNADIRVLRHRECATIPEYANGSFSMLEDAVAFKPQVSVIASPAPFHLTAALPLARAGAHLLIEKPLSDGLDGVPELLKICREKQTVLMTAYNLRYLPSLQRFRTLLTESAIGKVLSIRCEVGQYLPSWRPDVDYRQCVSARQELGGGALLELSHELDYLRWIFGDVEWASATLLRQSSLEIDVEDSAHLTLGFARAADTRQLVGTVNMDFVRHDTTRICTAIGEKGSLRWDGLTGAVDHFEAGAKEWCDVFRHPHHRDDSYLAEWRNLTGCVNGQETPLISGEDGLMVLKVVDAARRSAASGCRAFV